MTRGKTIHISGPQPGSFFFKSWIKDTTYKSRESKKKKCFYEETGKYSVRDHSANMSGFLLR